MPSNTICPGCGQEVTRDDTMFETPPPARVVWHVRCHDRCAKAMKPASKFRTRPWNPGEREALEKSMMFPQIVRDDTVPPGLVEIRRAGEQV